MLEREAAITPKKVLEMKAPFDVSAFDQEPTEWGEKVTGVKTRIQTEDKMMALTFDACGGDHGGEVDEAFISFLRAEYIPATLFVNER